MRVAVIQLNSQDDVEANLERVRSLVGEAARDGAELVLLPEGFAFIGDDAGKRRTAEDIDGPSPGPATRVLVELARTHHIHVIGGGLAEKSGDPERPFNTSLHVRPDGSFGARYHKVHLFDVVLPDGTKLTESTTTTAGDEAVIAQVGDLRVGMTICYDMRFPELYRRLVDQGAEVVTVSAAFTLTTGKDHWHVLLRARAIEAQVYVLAAAQHGKHPKGRTTYGKSLVIDPWGEVIAQCSEGEGFAIARIDVAYEERVRAALPCRKHRKF